MPTGNSQTNKTFRRYVAPFAPLALALAVGQMPANKPSTTPEVNVGPGDNTTAVVCEENIADFRGCHDNYPTGCSQAGKYDAYLNYLKNLTPSAPLGGVNFLDQPAFDDRNRNTPENLGQGNNHADFKEDLAQLGEGSQYGITGYLYYFQATGAESSNCELTGPDAEGGNVDFHIGVGFDQSLGGEANQRTPSKPPKQLQQQSVIVEMTPHYRADFHSSDWTLATLRPALGHKVKVIGQLLADSEHNKPADNCALVSTAAAKSRCWRYSIWELHPVTAFAYCKDDSCTQNSNDWISLGTDGASGNTGETEGGAAHRPHS